MPEREQDKPSNSPGRALRCDECEDRINAALDGTLSGADAAAFRLHLGGCPACAQLYKETQQGRDWMHYLAIAPEPPGDLLGRILARTSGAGVYAAGPTPELAVPSRRSPRSLATARDLARQMGRHAFEPRLLMTVAMAFFSIALTVNLTGIRLSQIHATDLEPARMRATLTRQYYATNEQVTRYYLNLRLVYEMEARVRELRRSSQAEPVTLENPSPNVAPGANPQPPARDGNRNPVPKGELPSANRSGVRGGELLPVQFVLPARIRTTFPVFRALPSSTEDQAKRSLV